jgi:hypothetical protein
MGLLFKFFYVSIASVGLMACSTMGISRSDSSGYISSRGLTSAQEFYLERKSQNIEDIKEELSIESGRELQQQEIEAIKARSELRRLENGLKSELEKKQYYNLKPYFRSDYDRIQFLRLPDYDARNRWANMKGISADQKSFDSYTLKLIENNDIAKGMTRSAVLQSWGDPEMVEVAGDPIYGNERWKYSKLTSSEDGYNNETRFIYFEGGVVIGWETL